MIRTAYKKFILNPELHTLSLLGYKIQLTDSEQAVLTLIMSLDGVTHSDLSRLCGSSDTTHVCNINRKCREISGRNLIICSCGSYKINPDL